MTPERLHRISQPARKKLASDQIRAERASLLARAIFALGGLVVGGAGVAGLLTYRASNELSLAQAYEARASARESQSSSSFRLLEFRIEAVREQRECLSAALEHASDDEESRDLRDMLVELAERLREYEKRLEGHTVVEPEILEKGQALLQDVQSARRQLLERAEGLRIEPDGAISPPALEIEGSLPLAHQEDLEHGPSPASPLRAEFNDDLPAELIGLPDALSSRTGLGPAVSKVLDGDGADRRAKALALISPRLPEWLRASEGDLLQGCTECDGKTPLWHSVTIIVATLDEIEQGELAQGTSSDDSGWVKGRRSFVLSDSDDNDVHLEQMRVRHGKLDLQKSVYSWSAWWYDGAGIDWLMPIVRPDGTVAAHLLYSQYRDDYHDDVAATQKEAVRDWTKRSEKP